VGKETDRKWEEGEDPSVLDFTATEYGRTGKVLASEEIKDKIKEIGNEFARWLQGYRSEPGRPERQHK
jgi:hypothetical protein